MLAVDWLLKRVNMMCSAFRVRLGAHFIWSVDNCVLDFLSQVFSQVIRESNVAAFFFSVEWLVGY